MQNKEPQNVEVASLDYGRAASYFVILSSLLDILRFAFSFTFGRNKHHRVCSLCPWVSFVAKLLSD